MPLQVSFTSRDFSAPLHPGLRIKPLFLSWSAFGGPDRARLGVEGTGDQLFDLAGMLRCPVTVSDSKGIPVWWGFVDEISIFLTGSHFKISLAELFNKVQVRYSFLSPDGKLADHMETGYASNVASQKEYGIREMCLHRENIEETIAEELRDTFLERHAWPHSQLSQRVELAQPHAELKCSGWFSTLDWQTYENRDGFYANYGPGPGTINFGRPNWRLPSQKFKPGVDCAVKYVYFQLRKNGSPSGDLNARIYLDSGGSPAGSYLAVSQNVNASTLSASGYSWVRFTFTNPVQLSASTSYWCTCYITVSDSTNNIFMRVDENASYDQENHYAKYSDVGVWKVIPNLTSPGTYPHLIFRVVCLSDTGSQLLDISSAGNPFFERIVSFPTGVDASPYRAGGTTCLDEILKLMKLGTANQRMILARVTPQRHLHFYEQPDAAPTVYMDRIGKYYSLEGKPLAPYFPPVGQFAYLCEGNHFALPFDKNRVPTCFVQSAEYRCDGPGE